MTDLTDTYKEISAQEEIKLLKQQIFLMHELISAGEQLEVELKTVAEVIPQGYKFEGSLYDALSVYDHVSNRFLDWLHKNRTRVVFYEKQKSPD